MKHILRISLCTLSKLELNPSIMIPLKIGLVHVRSWSLNDQHEANLSGWDSGTGTEQVKASPRLSSHSFIHSFMSSDQLTYQPRLLSIIRLGLALNLISPVHCHYVTSIHWLWLRGHAKLNFYLLWQNFSQAMEWLLLIFKKFHICKPRIMEGRYLPEQNRTEQDRTGQDRTWHPLDTLLVQALAIQGD